MERRGEIVARGSPLGRHSRSLMFNTADCTHTSHRSLHTQHSHTPLTLRNIYAIELLFFTKTSPTAEKRALSGRERQLAGHSHWWFWLSPVARASRPRADRGVPSRGWCLRQADQVYSRRRWQEGSRDARLDNGTISNPLRTIPSRSQMRSPQPSCVGGHAGCL